MYFWHNDFMFKDREGGLYLYGYHGNSKDGIEIPSHVNGKPVTVIGEEAFKQKGIRSIVIPDTIEEIEFNAFRYNGLTKVTLPKNIVEITFGAFSYNKLVEVAIPDKVIQILPWALRNNNLAKITIPDSVKEIGSHAFISNNLTEVTIPDSVEVIGIYAFQGNNLTQINICGNVEIIEDKAFGNYTDQIKRDYEKNNRQPAIYVWDEGKQKWQNQLEQLLEKQGEDRIGNLLKNKNTSMTL